MAADKAFVIDGARTPIGAIGGVLASVRPDDLLAESFRKLLLRQPAISPGNLDDIIIGCANQAGEDNRNVARMAALIAGIPVNVPAETVNRLCASGMSAVVQARRAICADEGHLFIAGGVESMTRGPWVISKTSSPYGRDAKMYDSSFGWRFINPKLEAVYGCESMGQTAENLARDFKISREDQDQFALWSQEKYATALAKSVFDDEIIPVEISLGKHGKQMVTSDEFPKPETSMDVLSKLRPAFDPQGSVTAGNSSGLNDGAAALLIASSSAVENLSLQPLAEIISSGVSGVEPRIMGIGPVTASLLALSRAGLNLDDMNLIEINEAFASQVLACLRSLHIDDRDSRVNVNGGAIAIGHPLGMTGSRIIYTAALELRRRNAKYALVTMCIGGGQGYAVVLKNANFS